MRSLLATLLSIAATCATAETPGRIGAAYAGAQGAGYVASATRGAEFYARRFGVSEKMPACTACHTAQAGQAGQHAITGKAIKPLAPAANQERFSDPAKVEKWFKRNCKEVVGRECTSGEKADFIAYMAEVR